MLRRVSSVRIWLLAALAAAVLLTGCGASTKSPHATSVATSASGSPSARLTVTGTTTSPLIGAATSTTPAGGVTTPSATVIAQASAACRSRIASQTKLSASSKQALEAVCAAAAQNNQDQVSSVEAQACRQLVKADVPVADQQQALASCP
jgi:hypothetical protein